MYKITVYDDFFKKSFTGQFTGTQKEAIKQCKEFYALELDTDPKEINIIKIEHV